MKQQTIFFTSFLLPLFLIFSLSACLASGTQVTCPFTDITWESSLNDVEASEGDLLDSYYSSYNGTTYVYEKEYLGLDGTIKYMFDDKGKIKSIAWLYLPQSDEEMEEVYAELRDQTNKLYGKSGFDSDMTTAKGEVWYLEGGNILIGVMSTGVNEAIQYQFFHPEVSSDKPADNQGNSNSVLEKIFQ